MKIIILGRVKNGEIQLQRFFQNDLKKWEGKNIEITKVESSKTQQQLGYLFGVVFKIISEYTGFTVEETYQVYKRKYLRYHKEYKGKIYKFNKGLSQCKVSEAAEFIDKVIIHAQTDLGLIIPEPSSEFNYPE